MRRSLELLLCFLLLSMPGAGQQTTAGDWSAVTLLAVGTPVEVHRQNSGTVSGTIASVSPTSLALTLKSGVAASIDRQAIASVYRTEARHTLRGAAIGGLVGLGVGAGIGAGVCGATGPNTIGGCTRGQGTSPSPRPSSAWLAL